ncbi:hypothetical protein GLOTRDRAFT_91985 [Gloeophyllum trabeum ATCC 11539]|uniref:Peptide N-acetyl-beta-D-glucosaminyl asparaginase amidase A N-terminal domain-containing protein n=1 Tax=Gloeophyllum trabeum (strain ATCC 11539 / FP-39264 / Madison 617) TaxID=670483 RepID=S7QH96_GLOTA|nr:uncharacterized protein GLOTRDRAFT_91985 [Gloeophyllum trabeum ATCC 11539]EPQ58633.1 hypothetical protein GLOTRDRAFT_91985 [Gloeophyllum trabeum ATCC 11539]
MYNRNRMKAIRLRVNPPSYLSLLDSTSRTGHIRTLPLSEVYSYTDGTTLPSLRGSQMVAFYLARVTQMRVVQAPGPVLISLNSTVTSNGTQYDRPVTFTFQGVEIWRTSTPERVGGDGIIWTYLTDVTCRATTTDYPAAKKSNVNIPIGKYSWEHGGPILCPLLNVTVPQHAVQNYPKLYALGNADEKVWGDGPFREVRLLIDEFSQPLAIDIATHCSTIQMHQIAGGYYYPPYNNTFSYTDLAGNRYDRQVDAVSNSVVYDDQGGNLASTSSTEGQKVPQDVLKFAAARSPANIAPLSATNGDNMRALSLILCAGSAVKRNYRKYHIMHDVRNGVILCEY